MIAAPRGDASGARGRLLALVLIGLVAGVLSGLLGVGGGLLSVPAMTLLLHLPQHDAHASSLGAIVPTAAVGVLVFGASQHVDLAAGAFLAVGSLVGVAIGANVMRRLSTESLRRLFGMLLLAMAVVFALR